MIRYALKIALLLSVVSPAFAQLPLPLLDGNKPKKKKPATSPAKAEAPFDHDKTYPLPVVPPLPKGEAEALSGPIGLVKFKGIVNPGMGEFTVHSIERAEREGAQAVLIELDTPGGLVSTTQTMIQAILGAKVPVIVHVTPSGAHAASAGTIITLAAHIAAMAPATRIGAAHPVTGGGEDPEEAGGKHMGRKVENDLVALVEGIATERHRNVEWAKDAVRNSVSIHAERAVALGVVDLVARDRAELFEKLEGWELMLGDRKVSLHLEGAAIVEYELTIREQVVNMLANPGIAMILGVLGLIGIMVEIYHPGGIVPGVMGVLCIICSLIAVEQLPIDLGAALLTLAGVGLLIAELYTPTYGALGILGALGLTIGLLLLVDPTQPDFAVDDSIRLGLSEVLPVVIGIVAFVGYVGFYVLKAQRMPPFTGREALVGAHGFVLKPTDPSHGMVMVDGEYWKARSVEPLLEKDEIEVVEVNGLELRVRRRSSS